MCLNEQNYTIERTKSLPFGIGVSHDFCNIHHIRYMTRIIDSSLLQLYTISKETCILLTVELYFIADSLSEARTESSFHSD